MTLAEFIEQTKNLPKDTQLHVWDMGQGGIVPVREITWEPHVKGITFEPLGKDDGQNCQR